MEVTLEFLLAEGDSYDTAPLHGFSVEGVGALAAIPLPNDSVCLEEGEAFVVESRAFNWHSPTQVRVEIFVVRAADACTRCGGG
jgi:hypothetical protein